MKAFSVKLRLWKTQLPDKNNNMQSLGTASSCEQYAAATERLQQECDQRFAAFSSHSVTVQVFADLLCPVMWTAHSLSYEWN